MMGSKLIRSFQQVSRWIYRGAGLVWQAPGCVWSYAKYNINLPESKIYKWDGFSDPRDKFRVIKAV